MINSRPTYMPQAVWEACGGTNNLDSPADPSDPGRRKFEGGFLSASEDAVQQQGCGPAAYGRVVDLAKGFKDGLHSSDEV